jgi:hypothetical protein
VGRSGTFIALDRLVQCIEHGHAIDVFGTVHEMRLERCHMVQNEQQYIFIHHCLLYVLDNFFPHLISQNSNKLLEPSYDGSGQQFFSSKGPLSPLNTPSSYSRFVNGADTLWISSNHNAHLASNKNGRLEVHQNPAFLLEDDEGIAESGL